MQHLLEEKGKSHSIHFVVLLISSPPPHTSGHGGLDYAVVFDVVSTMLSEQSNASEKLFFIGLFLFAKYCIVVRSSGNLGIRSRVKRGTPRRCKLMPSFVREGLLCPPISALNSKTEVGALSQPKRC